MALIKCPECGYEISDKTTQCPHCGYVLKQEIQRNVQDTSKTIRVSKDLVKKLGIAGVGEIINLLYTICKKMK